MVRRTGSATFPLHGGKAPAWLFGRTLGLSVRAWRKDGTPYPVDRETYDRTIETMESALRGPDVDRSERVAAIARLARLRERAVPT